MAATTGLISRPNKRESRPTWAAERLPKCQLAGDGSKDSKTAVRVQFLTQNLGLNIARAAVIARLAWGEAA